MKRKVCKKIMAALLTAALATASLAGCGNGGGNESPGSQEEGTEGNGTGEEGTGGTGEVSQIVMTYLTMGTDPKDLSKVEAAVNELTVAEIGVEVKFKPISIMEAPSQYTVWIAGGEQIDLMCVAFADIASYIKQGMLKPIDELIQTEGQSISKLAEEFPLYDGAAVGDEIYGAAKVEITYGGGSTYCITREALESAGLSYEDGDRVTLDDLTGIFAAVKEANQDTYPCGVTGSLQSFGYTNIVDALGTTPSSGVLLGTDSTEVVNMYSSEEYYDYLKHLREWYEAGYIIKDAATTDTTKMEYIKAGTMCGSFLGGQKALKKGWELDTGKEFVQLHLTDLFLAATSPSSNVYWTIPTIAKEPEAAMRFLNMTYESEELVNLLQWGIEGEHYVFYDKEKGGINFPEGVDASSSSYNNSIGIWGNQRLTYKRELDYDPEEEVAFTEKAMENPTKGVGFCYDPSNMTNQITAIDAVIKEYVPTLETGSADLETTYQEFIDKLKANGIDEVVADKKAQFEAWLAGQ